MATNDGNSPRQLPNGRWMEEATDEKDSGGVERVLGTRLKNNDRHWLVQFVDHNKLRWISERGCGCDAAIKTFLDQMHWTQPPSTPDREYLHPTLLQHTAPRVAPQSTAAASPNPPPLVPALTPKKKVTFKDMDQTILVFGLEEEAAEDEDEHPKTAPKKHSCTETSTASQPTTSRDGGNKSTPINGPPKATPALHARSIRCEEDHRVVAAAAVPPKPRKPVPAKKVQDEEKTERQDEDDKAKKTSKKRAYADSPTPGPLTSGGGKKPKLLDFVPTPKPSLAVKTARRVKDDNAEATAPQLKLSAAPAANAVTNVTPTMHGAVTTAAASPTQPQQPYGFQRGLILLAVIDVRREAGRTLAEVRYDNGAKELVPTALLAQHAAEAKVLNAFYENHDKPKTSGK